MTWQQRTIDERRDHARKAGRKAARVSKYPLRAVKGRINHPDYPQYDMPVVLLECGHWLHLHDDGSYPNRRRCYKCAQGLPADGGEPAGPSSQTS